jgi:hypothetical protein
LIWWQVHEFFAVAECQNLFSLQFTEFIGGFFFNYLPLIGYTTKAPVLQGAHCDTNNFTGWLLSRPMKNCYGY